MDGNFQHGQRVRLLRVDSSGRYEDSVSRQLTDIFISELQDRCDELLVTSRDLARGVPFVNQAWIGANFTSPEWRSGDHRGALSYSDGLVRELKAADVLVIAFPIYNFGVPAVLKAWVDMVARARETFRYTETGPEGMLQGIAAYLIVTSGGTLVGSDVDFASRYMRHVLDFLGISAVTVISADRLNVSEAGAIDHARSQIQNAVAAFRHPKEVA